MLNLNFVYRVGTISSRQLKKLAAHGIVTPGTTVETEEGKPNESALNPFPVGERTVFCALFRSEQIGVRSERRP